MAEKIIEQVEPYILKILYILREHRVEPENLYALNERVEKAIENYIGIDASCPITVEFKRFRRSGRQAYQSKRSYKDMQGVNKRTGRSLKKLKLGDGDTAAVESSSDLDMIEDHPATAPAVPGEGTGQGTSKITAGSAVASLREVDETIGSRAIVSIPTTKSNKDGITIVDAHVFLDLLFAPLINESNELLVSKINADEKDPPATPSVQAYAYKAISVSSATNPAASSVARSNLGSDRADGFEGVNSSSSSGSPQSVPHSAELINRQSSKASSPDIGSPKVITPFAKHLVLDDAAQFLEQDLVALANVCDDRPSPNSSLPGVLNNTLLTNNYPTLVKIMSSVTTNWAKSNHQIARPALEIAKERLREVEEHTLDRPRVGQKENTRQDRTQSLGLKHAIACGEIRELLWTELQKLTSESTELTGELSNESDYENAIKYIEKETANEVKIQLRRLWEETYFWPMIQQRAKMMGELPKSPGPRTDITPQEKVVAKKLVIALGYGQSRNNIFKWTAYWRLLSDLRNKQATTFLLARTPEFKNYFFQHSKELDVLLSWHTIYDFPLRLLRLRVIAQEGGDFSGRCDIEEESICGRLHAPQNKCWGDHLSVWDQDSTEYESFLAEHELKATSTKPNIHVLHFGIKGGLHRNKAIYISLVPYEAESSKKAFGNKTSSTRLIAVAPLVPVSPGDFLGIFPGQLRYTAHKPARAISGPVQNLWLDYSKVMGKLNKVKVAKAGEVTNVCLAWEAVNESKGYSSCQYLRVLVIATRNIMPFEQLLRSSSGAGMLSEHIRRET